MTPQTTPKICRCKLILAPYLSPKPATIRKIDGLPTHYIHFTPHEGIHSIRFHSRLQHLTRSWHQKLGERGMVLRLVNNPIRKFLAELNSMAIRVAVSLMLLMVVIYLFYGQFKYSFIVILSLLVTILCAACVIYLMDIEINMYALAGAALSFGLIVDNILVTMHHLIIGRPTSHRFAIIAATLSSIGTSFTIFLLPREQAMLLEGFVLIIGISLTSSLLVSLILIPQLMGPKAPQQVQRRSYPAPRATIWSRIYMWTTTQLLKWRKATILLLVLAFGLPVYLIPTESQTNTAFDDFYNRLVTSDKYLDHIQPFLNTYLGGLSGRFRQHIQNAQLPPKLSIGQNPT